MENKVLQKNLEAISEYDKNLSDKILMFDIEKSNIGLIETEKKEYNIVFNNIPLHSQNGAIDEAKAIVAGIERKKEANSIRLLYGLGLGYLLDEMANEIEESLIIVYEPNIDILKLVFSIAEISAINKKNVLICSDKKMLKQHIIDSKMDNPNLTISFLSSYKNLFLEDIKEILNFAQKTLGENSGNSKTFKRKALQACRNVFWCMATTLKNPNILDLTDIYKGKTALCLSAGPSLKENIEIIKDNQDKFVIFAVNPTIKLLSQYGIKPDFIVDIEATDTTSQIMHVNTEEHYFIFEGFTSNYVKIKKNKKAFNYISNDNFFNYFLRDCLKIEEKLETFGTVSYTALMSAVIMGFKKIILCGQDLAYKNGECYAKGSQYEQLECVYNETEKKYEIKVKNEEAFIKSFETVYRKGDYALRSANNYLRFVKDNICTVKSQDGKDIPTQTGYALFIKQFSEAAEKIKNEKPEIELINSSVGGAQIDGFENKSLSEIILGLEKVEKLDLTSYTSNLDKEYASFKLGKLVEQMKVFHKYSQDLEIVVDKIIKEIKNKKVLTRDLEKLLNKNKEILANIIELSKKKDVSFVVTAFMCRFIELFEINYNENPIDWLENFNEIKIQLGINNDYMTKDITQLSKCQAFILK